MSNYISLYCLASDELVDGVCGQPHSNDCFESLQAINSVPLLWMLLFRQANLQQRSIFEDEPEPHSVLVASKKEALKNLAAGVDVLADKYNADFSQHARLFKRYLNACPGQWIALPGVAEWVYGDAGLGRILKFLEKPTKKDIVKFLQFFRGWEEFHNPPSRQECRKEWSKAIKKKDFNRSRTEAYIWIFGFPQLDEDDRDDLPDCPWAFEAEFA